MSSGCRGVETTKSVPGIDVTQGIVHAVTPLATHQPRSLERTASRMSPPTPAALRGDLLSYLHEFTRPPHVDGVHPTTTCSRTLPAPSTPPARAGSFSRPAVSHNPDTLSPPSEPSARCSRRHPQSPVRARGVAHLGRESAVYARPLAISLAAQAIFAYAPTSSARGACCRNCGRHEAPAERPAIT